MHAIPGPATRLARLARLLVLGVALAFAGCASVPDNRPPPLAIADIVKLSKDGMPAEDIIKRIEASRAVYRLSGADYGRLRADGVPDRVLDYLQRSYVEFVRRDEWLRQRDLYSLRWGPWLGPYPGWGPYGRFWW